MKSLLLMLCLFSQTLAAQISFKVGISYSTGIFGCELNIPGKEIYYKQDGINKDIEQKRQFIHNFGLDLGWRPQSANILGVVYKTNVYSVGLSYYFLGYDKVSPYLSSAYCFNAVDELNKYNTVTGQWQDCISILAGYHICIDFFDFKFGMGAWIRDRAGMAIDFSIGFNPSKFSQRK
jgi:hypothetical protein